VSFIDYPENERGGLIMPDGRIIEPHLETGDDGVQRVPGLMSRAEWDQLQAVLTAKFFLFHNDGGDVGERMKCQMKMPDGTIRGCGNYHPYITYMCVERPFKGGTGLETGLYLMFRAAKNRTRQEQIRGAINMLPKLDLSVHHPFSAAQWAPKTPGENWLAALVSLPAPITKEQARKFAVRVNTEKRPPVYFCLQEGCPNYLEDDIDCPRTHHLL